MRNILFFFLIIYSIQSKSQCVDGICIRQGAPITAAFIVDNSFKFYQPSGFAGIGIHAGILGR